MYADVNGTRLYYEILGEGRPILLSHGGLGAYDHTSFKPWLEPLAGEFQLIFYDHRGGGRSERPESLADFGDADWGDDMDALRAHLGHERITVLGHSYGSSIATHFAVNYPQHLDGFIFVSGYPAWDFTETVLENLQARATPEQLEAVGAGFSASIQTDEQLAEMYALVGSVYFSDPGGEAAKTYGAETNYSALAFNRSIVDLLPVYDMADRIHEIAAPTLIISGSNDWITPYDKAAARLHRDIEGSELVRFSHSGHMPFAEEPEKFLQVVCDWLRKL